MIQHGGGIKISQPQRKTFFPPGPLWNHLQTTHLKGGAEIRDKRDETNGLSRLLLRGSQPGAMLPHHPQEHTVVVFLLPGHKTKLHFIDSCMVDLDHMTDVADNKMK